MLTETLRGAEMSSMNSLVSIVLPAYNEEQILHENMEVLLSYLEDFGDKYRWEIIIVNDGSSDGTAKIADDLSENYDIIKAIHHKNNAQLGAALQTGFNISKGDYVITLDIDLSYSPDHIGKLLSTIEKEKADIVVASPYMKGGEVKNVPMARKFVSKIVNKYMSFFSQQQFSTFTSMVRAYKGDFIRSLDLKSVDFEISPEIMYKAFILRADIVEIPATLCWDKSRRKNKNKTSVFRIAKGVLPGLMSGFIFRPYVFFLVIGGGLLLIATYIIVWLLIHTFSLYPDIVLTGDYNTKFSLAVAEVFRLRPHAFVVGGVVLIVALQFMSMGFLSIQNKRYFEEQYHLTTELLKQNKIKNND